MSHKQVQVPHQQVQIPHQQIQVSYQQAQVSRTHKQVLVSLPICIQVAMIGLVPLLMNNGALIILEKLRKRVKDLNHGNNMPIILLAVVQTQIMHGTHFKQKKKAINKVKPVDLLLGTIGRNIFQKIGTKHIQAVEKTITQVSVSQMQVKMQILEFSLLKSREKSRSK